MLRSKKAIFILIPLNIAIWGYFIHRFFVMYNPGTVPVTEGRIKFSPAGANKDSIQYTLSLQYKDPFLKEEKRYHAPSANKTPSKPKTVQVLTITPVKPPNIKFLGMVKNTSSGQVMGLISLNGSSHIVKPREILEGVTFNSITKDSAVVQFAKQKLVIRKSG